MGNSYPQLFISRLKSDKSWFFEDRECIRTGAAGAQTRRPLGHQLLHPQILTDQISENPSMYVVSLYVVLTFIDRNQFLANRSIY